MPVTVLKEGDCGTITGVSAAGATRDYLFGLGFCVGERVCVAKHTNGGVILRVKESKMALDLKTASLILI